MTQAATDTRNHCAYCGHAITHEAATPERFGERFCTEAHAEEFVAGVRAARMEAAARNETGGALSETKETAVCALPPTGQQGWSHYAKRAACWGAPLLLLLALPLISSGGWVATGGSLLSVIALLACPLGMYFMMRGMTTMQREGKEAEPGHDKEDRRA